MSLPQASLRSALRLAVAFSIALTARMPESAAADPEPSESVPKRPRCIAVLPLKNLQPGRETDWVGPGAAETLTTLLAGIPGLVTAERVQIQRVIDEQALQKLDLFDPARAVKVGKFVGAQRIVLGSYVRHERDVLFNVRVVDVQTATVVSTAAVRGRWAELVDVLYKVAEAVVASFDRRVVIVDARPVVERDPGTGRILLTEKLRQRMRDAGTQNAQAYEAFAKGCAAANLSERLRWLDRAIERDEKFAYAYAARGWTFAVSRDPRAALKDLDRFVELQPHSGVAYMARGMARLMAVSRRPMSSGVPAGPYLFEACGRAVADLTKALELRPDLTEAYVYRGSAHAMARRPKSALADYTRAVRLNPSAPRLYIVRADAYRAAGKLKEGLADCEKAIELVLDYGAAYGMRGRLRAAGGQLDLAIQDLTRAIKLDPDNGGLFSDRARVHYARKEYVKAREDVIAAVRRGYVVDIRFMMEVDRKAKEAKKRLPTTRNATP